MRNQNYILLLKGMKEVHPKENRIEAKERLKEVLMNYEKHYKKALLFLNASNLVFSFINFTKSIRAIIYTTNLIEGLNKKNKKKYIRRKVQFPNESSTDALIRTLTIDENNRNRTRVHKGIDSTQYKQSELFQ